MVQAIVSISDHANMVLNVVKAKYGLRDKSQAIELMAEQYEENILEPQLRPEYVQRAAEISKEKPIRVGTVAQLRKRYE